MNGSLLAANRQAPFSSLLTSGGNRYVLTARHDELPRANISNRQVKKKCLPSQFDVDNKIFAVREQQQSAFRLRRCLPGSSAEDLFNSVPTSTACSLPFYFLHQTKIKTHEDRN
ncbi:MAG TPA: hypothetical protein VMB22_06755 [Verrucomicrobiae bacterium]|nr:hypothetical protein [Verrucomicrobiae bacterium]